MAKSPTIGFKLVPNPIHNSVLHFSNSILSLSATNWFSIEAKILAGILSGCQVLSCGANRTHKKGATSGPGAPVGGMRHNLGLWMGQCWVVLGNRMRTGSIFRLILTLNLISYHIFSHKGWKSSFPVLTKLRTGHHENWPGSLCKKNLYSSRVLGFNTIPVLTLYIIIKN
jgi:hypothetical protein